MKLLFLTILLMSISGCASNQGNTPTTPTAEVPVISAPLTQSPNLVEVKPLAAPTSNDLTLVATVDAALKTDEAMDTVSLYTSAKKSGGKFQWDDHAKWVMELVTEQGEIYELYNTTVSNGSIYFDVVEIEGKKYILLKNISTAADYTRVFTFKDQKLYETDELNLNEMKDKVINLIYTSIPKYR